MIRTVVIAAMLAVMTPAWAKEDDAIETLTVQKAREFAKHELCLSLDGGCGLTRPEMSQGNPLLEPFKHTRVFSFTARGKCQCLIHIL